MAKFVMISDPNYSAGGHADFRIHRHGCRDIEAHIRKPRFRHAGHCATIEAESAEAIVKAELARLDDEYEPGSWSEDQFLILPCCKTAE